MLKFRCLLENDGLDSRRPQRFHRPRSDPEADDHLAVPEKGKLVLVSWNRFGEALARISLVLFVRMFVSRCLLARISDFASNDLLVLNRQNEKARAVTEMGRNACAVFGWERDLH
jgi:hypothetical protein